MQSYHVHLKVANSKGGSLVQTNRSFLYGESVFTTAMLMQGRILFLANHLDRLLKGANFLWGPFNSKDLGFLRDKIESGIPQKGNQDGLRITLSYQDAERMILRNNFNVSGIQVDYFSFDKGEKKNAILKSVKTSDEQELLPSFLKNSRRVQQTISLYKSGYLNQGETLLFCGPDEEVYETSWANIFAVKENILYTPSSGGSVLAGIMREKILQFKGHHFSKVKEESFTLSFLKNCDFAFVSNALWGVIPVVKIDATNLNQPTESFFDFEKVILNEEIRSKVSNL